MKAATLREANFQSADIFQSTPPVKAATDANRQWIYSNEISIHAAREGGDPLVVYYYTPVREFQSTPPVKAATAYTHRLSRSAWISIHAAREGGDELRLKWLEKYGISIHAAREGGDIKPAV